MFLSVDDFEGSGHITTWFMKSEMLVFTLTGNESSDIAKRGVEEV